MNGEVRANIVKLLYEGMSPLDIADKIGCSTQYAFRVRLQSTSSRTVPRTRQNRKGKGELYKPVRDLILAGKNATEIVSETGCRRSYVYHVAKLHEHNLPKSPNSGHFKPRGKGISICTWLSIPAYADLKAVVERHGGKRKGYTVSKLIREIVDSWRVAGI